MYHVGRDSSVGIATHYWLEDLGGGEVSRLRPDRPCSLPRLLHKGCRVTFIVVKRLGRGVDYPPASSAEVRE
jgi:hypothetical protein